MFPIMITPTLPVTVRAEGGERERSRGRGKGEERKRGVEGEEKHYTL